ncbi:hypothetical protein JW766_00450 [Candidatus Dojkabacteria bacterium]|nr:hypothetical protein [Candidatus Dojkabacteria bacterium]
MKKSRVWILLLFIFLVGLGGAAVWIGWRLQQEEEVIPQESEAAAGDHQCIGYNNNPDDWGHVDFCLSGTSTACNEAQAEYYAGKGCRGCCSKMIPCTKQQVDYDNDYKVVVYGPNPGGGEWCREYLPGDDGSRKCGRDTPDPDTWDWTNCTVCDDVQAEWDFDSQPGKVVLRITSAAMHDMDNINSSHNQDDVPAIMSKQRMRVEINRYDAGGNVIGSAQNISGQLEFLPDNCSLTYKLGKSNAGCNYGRDCAIDPNDLCCDGNGPRWGTWNGGYRCNLSNTREYTFDVDRNADSYGYTFYVEGFSPFTNSQWKTADTCKGFVDAPEQFNCGDPCTNPQGSCDDGSNCIDLRDIIPAGEEACDGYVCCVGDDFIDEFGNVNCPFSEHVASGCRCLETIQCDSMSSPQAVGDTITVQQEGDTFVITVQGTDGDGTIRQISICSAVANQPDEYYRRGLEVWNCEETQSADNTFTITRTYASLVDGQGDDDVLNPDGLDISANSIVFAANLWDEPDRSIFCSSNPGYGDTSHGILYGNYCSQDPAACDLCNLGTNSCRMILQLAEEECDCTSIQRSPSGDTIAPGSNVWVQVTDSCEIGYSEVEWFWSEGETGTPQQTNFSDRIPGPSDDPELNHSVIFSVPVTASGTICIWARTQGEDDPDCRDCFNIGGEEEPAYAAVKTSEMVCINNNSAARITYRIHVRNISGVVGTIDYVEDTYDSRIQTSWVSGISPLPYEHTGNVIRWDNNDTGYVLQPNDGAAGGADEIEFSYIVTVPSEYFGTWEGGVFVPYQYRNHAVVKPRDEEPIELATVVSIQCAVGTGIFSSAVKDMLIGLILILLGLTMIRIHESTYKYLIPIEYAYKESVIGLKNGVNMVRTECKAVLDKCKTFVFERFKLTSKERFERKIVRRAEKKKGT